MTVNVQLIESSTFIDAWFESGVDCSMENFDFCHRERIDLAVGMEAGKEEDIVNVCVPDTCDSGLIEKK